MDPTGKVEIRGDKVVAVERIGLKTAIVGMTAIGTLVIAAIGAYVIGTARNQELENNEKNRVNLDRYVAKETVATPHLEATHQDSSNQAQVGSSDTLPTPSSINQETPQQLKDRLARIANSPEQRAQLDRDVNNTVVLKALPPNSIDLSGRAPIDEAVQAAVRLGVGVVTGTNELPQDPLRRTLAERENEGRWIEVQAGDTLWSIATRAYGDPYQYRKILEANARTVTSPNQIYPGQRLRVPI